jgi:transcriptional regulator with XRE-family HTH domain
MARNWEDVRDEAAVDPTLVQTARYELLASVRSAKLAEVRRSRSLTQSDVASQMGVTQVRVSQIERGQLTASEVGTLVSYIEALGGRLTLVAEFGDQSVVVDEPRPDVRDHAPVRRAPRKTVKARS